MNFLNYLNTHTNSIGYLLGNENMGLKINDIQVQIGIRFDIMI